MFEGKYHQLLCQRSMILDTWRTNQYREAVLNTVKTGDVVIDFGAGSGILSLFAAQAGAKKVYSIEREPIMAETIRKNAAMNGFEDIIEVYQGDGDLFECQEPVNVILSECIGDHLIENRMFYITYKLAKKFLAEDGKVIPSEANLYVTPVYNPMISKEREFFEHNPYNLNLSVMLKNNSNFKRLFIVNETNNLTYYGKQLLANLNYDTFDPKKTNFSGALKFHFKENSSIHGFLLTWDCLLGHKENGEPIILHNCPTREQNLSLAHSWVQNLLLLDTVEQQISANQTVYLNFDLNVLFDCAADVDGPCNNISYDYKIV